MKNKFSRDCDYCGVLVYEGAGLFRHYGRHGLVFHPACEQAEAAEQKKFAAYEKELNDELRADEKAMAYLAGKGIRL